MEIASVKRMMGLREICKPIFVSGEGNKNGPMKARQSKRKADSLLVPAYEVMHMASATRSLIRGNKGYQIDNTIAAATDS